MSLSTSKANEPITYSVNQIAQLFPSLKKIKQRSLREKVATVWSEAITTGCGGKGWTKASGFDSTAFAFSFCR